MAGMTEKRLAEEIGKELGKVLRGIGKTAGSNESAYRGGSTTDGPRKATKIIDGLDTELTNKNFKKLANSASFLIKEMDNFGTSAKKSSYSMDELIGTQSHLLKSMVNHDNATNDVIKKLVPSLRKQLEGYSFMGKSMKEHTKSLQDMMVMFDKSGEMIANYSNTLDELNVATLDEVKGKDNIKKALEKMSKGLDQSSALRKQIDKATKSNNKSKMNIAKKSLQEEIRNAKKIRSVTQEGIVKHEAMNTAFQNGKTVMDNFASSVGLGFYKQMATLVGSVALLGFGIKGLYNQFTAFSAAGFGSSGAFSSAISGMFTLGVSQDAYIASLKENANTVAQIGLDGFNDVIKDTRNSLMTLGMGTEAAMKGTMAFTEAAKSASVGMGTAAMVKSIKDQTKSYKTLFAITGITAEQFAQQNEQLLESNDFRTQMARMNKMERANVMNGIMLERERLTVMGLSNEQALEFIKVTQSALGGKVTDRFDQSAQLVQALGAMGMGDKAGAARNIIMKGSRANNDEKAQLKDIMMELEGRFASTAGGSNGLQSENLVDSLREGLSGGVGEMIESARSVRLGTTKSISKEQLEQRKLDVTRNKAMTNLDIGLSTVSAIISNPLVSILAGVVGIAALMMRGQGILKGLGKAFGGTGSTTKKAGMFSRAASAVKGGIKGTFGAIGSGISSASNFVSSKVGQVGQVGAKAPGAAKGLASTGLGTALKTGGKVLMGAAKFLGPLAAAGFAIAGGISAYGRASEIFGKEVATTQEKISAGIAGAVSSLTFGLIPEEGAAKFINAGLNKAKEFGSLVKDSVITGAKSLWSGMKDAAGFASESIQSGFTMFGKMLSSAGKFAKETASKAWEGLKNIGSSVLGFFGMTDDKTTEAKRSSEKLKEVPSINITSPATMIMTPVVTSFDSTKANRVNVPVVRNPQREEIPVETVNKEIQSTTTEEPESLMEQLIIKVQQLVDLATEENVINSEKMKTDKFSALRNSTSDEPA